MTWRWRIPRPARFPATHRRVDVYLDGALIERLDEQSDRWTIGPNKILEIAADAATTVLEQLAPIPHRLSPIPYDSLNAAVAGAMMERMDPIRTVPKPNTISSIDGEDIPDGAEPDHPEADAPLQEGDRPESEPKTDLLLETE